MSSNSLQTMFIPHIEQCGLSIVGTPEFSYSVGRANIGQPDILIYSTDTKACQWIINMLHEDFSKNGLRLGFINDLTQDANGADLPLYVAEIRRSKTLLNEYVVQAERFYKANPDYVKEPVCYIQVLWADNNKLLPFQNGYNHSKYHQVILADTPTSLMH